MNLQPNLYLASKSSRRRDLLSQIGVNFTVLTVNVPELKQDDESPERYVQRLAQDKALAGASMVANCPVLGADTIVVLNGQVMEKPRSSDDAITMLLNLSGQTHQVMTAVAVAKINSAAATTLEVSLNITQVSFRRISRSEAEAYWQSGEPKDKAGGYGIQGLGAVFVEQIHGSYSAVVGLPLLETAALLHRFEVPVWQG